MVISQCDLDVRLSPQVVAAITAVIFQILEEENSSSSYVPKKNKNWKELARQERCWVLRLRR